MSNQKFLSLLVSNGILNSTDTSNLLNKFKGNTKDLIRYLIQGGAVKKSVIGQLWGDSLEVAYVDLSKTLFQGHVVQKLPEDFAKKHTMIPLYNLGSVYTIAMADPLNNAAIKEAERLLQARVSPVFSFADDLEDAIEVEYQTSGSLKQMINKIADNALFKGTSKITEEQIKKLAGDSAVVEFVRGMLLLGVKERASDIHVEPDDDIIRVRLRIDGVLQERLKIEKALLGPLVTRLKVMSNLDITERRRPQDGRVSLKIINTDIDFRFSSVPTIYGEKLVLRILGMVRSRNIPELTDLYLSANIQKSLNRVIETPNGVFFITGPTGSGKTTTLYAILKHLNKPGVNIMTIEDPVEYRLKGINQVQVNHDIDLNFSTALRSFLRQDPDVILVGEIRDTETAKIGAQAALTGHLVLATMHTNNALQAVTRMVEIGVEPFLVAPSIIGVMAQRLVRKLCDNCKSKYKLTPEEINEHFFWDGEGDVFFYKAEGCEQCNGVGYSGRIAIHELFVLNAEMRSMISREESILEIQNYARNMGFKPLRYDGLKKVLRGITTIDEVNRVTVSYED